MCANWRTAVNVQHGRCIFFRYLSNSHTYLYYTALWDTWASDTVTKLTPYSQWAFIMSSSSSVIMVPLKGFNFCASGNLFKRNLGVVHRHKVSHNKDVRSLMSKHQQKTDKGYDSTGFVSSRSLRQARQDSDKWMWWETRWRLLNFKGCRVAALRSMNRYSSKQAAVCKHTAQRSWIIKAAHRS